jgi:hypothetical protein
MKPDVLAVGKLSPRCMQALEESYTLHKLYEAEDEAAFLNAGHQLMGRRHRQHRPGACAPARHPGLQHAGRARR